MSPHPRLLVALLACVGLLTACGRKSGETTARDPGVPAYLDLEDITPAEKAALQAAAPFAEAVAARNYSAAYDLLSAHARARMSHNQFAPATDDAEFERREAGAERSVSRERFAALMQRTEQELGRPAKLTNLHVHSSDPDELSGAKREGLDALSTVMAIGAMPDSVPAALRKASIRGQVRVELAPAQLAEIAKAHETTVDELVKDPDFEPYLNLKLVMIDDAGALRVGYFEFMPPSMWD